MELSIFFRLTRMTHARLPERCELVRRVTQRTMMTARQPDSQPASQYRSRPLLYRVKWAISSELVGFPQPLLGYQDGIGSSHQRTMVLSSPRPAVQARVLAWEATGGAVLFVDCQIRCDWDRSRGRRFLGRSPTTPQSFTEPVCTGLLWGIERCPSKHRNDLPHRCAAPLLYCTLSKVHRTESGRRRARVCRWGA